MTYFMAAGVVLWVLFRRIMFKVWWAVAVFAITLPCGADTLTRHVALTIHHGDGYGEFYTSRRLNRTHVTVPITNGLGYFYLSTDPTSSEPGFMGTNGYLIHAIAINKVGLGEWVRVDIWGPLITLTTYRSAHHQGYEYPALGGNDSGYLGGSNDEAGWVPSMDYDDWPLPTSTDNTVIATDRAPNGEEAEYGSTDFYHVDAQYWLQRIRVSNTAWVNLPIKDDDDIADPTSSYTPDPTPDISQSDMFDEIEASLDASELQPFDDSEDFRDEVLHEDLIPEFDLPEDVAALKVCISAAMTSLLGNAAWQYDSPTYGSHNDYDTTSFATTLFGEGDMYPFLVFAFVDALEVAHVEWGPWFAALRAFLTLCFTISVLFMIIRLTLWSFGIVNPFGSPVESVEFPEFGSSYAEGT